jgi:hypothetical protein
MRQPTISAYHAPIVPQATGVANSGERPSSVRDEFEPDLA